MNEIISGVPAQNEEVTLGGGRGRLKSPGRMSDQEVLRSSGYPTPLTSGQAGGEGQGVVLWGESGGLGELLQV